MLKILLVDDSVPRAKLIKQKFREHDLLHHMVFVTCISADAARVELLESCDLMILDVLLPKKDHGTPQALHSLNLLKDLADSGKPFIRPKMIIGLTADISGLQTHQKTFLDAASVVLDGNLNSQDWVDSLIRQVATIVGASQKIEKLATDQMLISVHGIRTYGGWQRCLIEEIKKYSRSFDFVEIKYGYLDLFYFFVPWSRKKKAVEIGRRLAVVIDQNQDKRILVVAHSFGTVILSEALKFVDDSSRLGGVVMCGSPLSEKTNIDHIVDAADLTVNECGVNDNVLLLSKLLVPGLGYAGRVGFYRENTSRFLNRYHVGGHSLYFEDCQDGTTFVEEQWLPMLIGGECVDPIDSRSVSLAQDVSVLFVRCVDKVKNFKYLLLICIAASCGYYFLK
jgi:CheY-like chemotaxis protein